MESNAWGGTYTSSNYLRTLKQSTCTTANSMATATATATATAAATATGRAEPTKCTTTAKSKAIRWDATSD